jgi:predicted NBD/HSP70 family sugar kinase
MDLAALRHHNAARLLGHLRAAGGEGVSRLELAERTGLTPQAVSKITARLRAEGLAEQAGRGASTGGKPRTLLRLVPGARLAAGVRLDRDELTVVLADLAGEVVATRTAPLDLGRPAPAVLDSVTRATRSVVAEAAAPVIGVGIAAPGPLDHATGVLHRVTGFPHWDGFPLRDALAERLGLPAVLDKDTNAAAYAIAAPGATESFAYLHLGTGLGAGLVLGGAVHRGRRTGAGEFGHQVVRLDGPPCACGNHGCLEALCLEAVRRGDPVGAARLLGVGAANLIALLDLDRLALGGRTVLADPDTYVSGVEAVVRERTGRRVAVGRAPRSPAHGAALLALAPLFGRPVG